MTCRLIQLAPGAYDVLRHGEIVASVVRHSSRSKKWSAELLDDLPRSKRPEPFTESEHHFGSFEDICEWLGRPPVKAIRRARDMMWP
jgi:hypothetical protein